MADADRVTRLLRAFYEGGDASRDVLDLEGVTLEELTEVKAFVELDLEFQHAEWHEALRGLAATCDALLERMRDDPTLFT